MTQDGKGLAGAASVANSGALPDIIGKRIIEHPVLAPGDDHCLWAEPVKAHSNIMGLAGNLCIQGAASLLVGGSNNDLYGTEAGDAPRMHNWYMAHLSVWYLPLTGSSRHTWLDNWTALDTILDAEIFKVEDQAPHQSFLSDSRPSSVLDNTDDTSLIFDPTRINEAATAPFAISEAAKLYGRDLFFDGADPSTSRRLGGNQADDDAASDYVRYYTSFPLNISGNIAAQHNGYIAVYLTLPDTAKDDIKYPAKGADNAMATSSLPYGGSWGAYGWQSNEVSPLDGERLYPTAGMRDLIREWMNQVMMFREVSGGTDHIQHYKMCNMMVRGMLSLRAHRILRAPHIITPSGAH